jgi:hypothetical protein
MNILNHRRQLLKGIISCPVLFSLPILLSSTNKPYYIIVNADFSGHYKKEGIEQYNGVLAAIKELTNAYPELSNIQVIKSDNKCREDLVNQSIAKSLIEVKDNKQVLFITGGSSSLVFQKQRELCHKLGILHLGGTCTTSMHSRQSYSIFPSLNKLNANIMPSFKPEESILVINDSTKWGEFASKYFVKKLKGKKVEIQISTTRKLQPSMLEGKNYVYLGAYNQNTALLIETIFNNNPNITILSPVLSLYNLESIPKKYHSKIVTNDILFKGSKRTDLKYKKNFGVMPTHVASTSYYQSLHALKSLYRAKKANGEIRTQKNLSKIKTNNISLKSTTLERIINKYENIT